MCCCFLLSVVSINLLEKMKNYLFLSAIISSILCEFVSQDTPHCWEENQRNHKLVDLKGNEEVFNHIAFGLEEGQVGKK